MTVRTYRSGRWPTSGHRLSVDIAAAVALTVLSALASVAQGLAQGASGPDTPAEIVAAQIRAQGYACSAPVSATRDREASQPGLAVWVLDCGEARYRVRLVPDMAAQVTRLR